MVLERDLATQPKSSAPSPRRAQELVLTSASPDKKQQMWQLSKGERGRISSDAHLFDNGGRMASVCGFAFEGGQIYIYIERER